MATNISANNIKKETTENSLEIQKYFDKFNKELENENDLVEISQIEEEAEQDEEPGTYFVDEDGQFYFQPATVVEEPQIVTADPDQLLLPEAGVQYEVSIQNPTQSDELSYVYIVEENEQNQTKDENDMAVYDFQDEDEVEERSQSPIESDQDDKSQIVKIKSGGKVFQCNFCEYSNKKKFLLARHLKIHTHDKPHKCSVCSKGFRTVVALNNHENTHTGAKPYNCDSCPAAFATTGELVRHMRYIHTKLKPHKCTECNYAAVEMSKLRRHQRCHSGERPYQCPHCTYASPDTFKLKRHLRVHTGERPYSCDICHAAFSQSNSLKAHRLTHYPERKPTFQCLLCPTKCGRKADLRGHIRKLHTSLEPLECKRCGKRLTDRYSYKLHVRSHGGEKSFKCDICPYASASQLHLSSHMLIHTNEKPFSCELCDQSFRQKQLLRRHQNLYHNPAYIPPVPKPKNHECEECGKKFIHQGNLIRHLALHDPESNIHEENLALKLGRKQKVQNMEEVDETSQIIVNEEDGEEGEEGQYVVFEMIQLEEDGKESKVQIVDSVVIDKKPVVDAKQDMENCFGFNEEEDDCEEEPLMSDDD